MSEAEDNVARGVFVQMLQEPEHHSQPGPVGVEKDADGVDLLDARDVVEDAVNVLLVLLLFVRVSAKARGVNYVDKLLSKDKAVCGRFLGCSLAAFNMFTVSAESKI